LLDFPVAGAQDAGRADVDGRRLEAGFVVLARRRRGQDEHLLLTLIGLEGLLPDQERRVGIADREPHAHEQARSDHLVRIRELGTEPQGAGVDVDPVVGEVDDPLVGETLLVGEIDLHGDFLLRLGLDFAFLDQLLHRRRSRRRGDPG
jgi:hypothetical protein